ncbi:MAG: hypothetical protein ACOX6K_00890 [Sphaerochaetaceae bacterium]|jgi:hypothetical protein
MEDNENKNTQDQNEGHDQKNFYQANGEGRPASSPIERKLHAGNSVASLTLGVLSLFAATSGIGVLAGIILAIIGLLQGNWARKANPSDGMAQAGFILSIIGLVMSAFIGIFGLVALRMAFGFVGNFFRYGYCYW